MTEEWSLRRLMSEVVGSGPKTASDMTAAQAGAAMERVLSGEFDPVALGGFLTANRWKRNTPVELAAFVDAMQRVSVERGVPEVDPVDVGANYDGKVGSAPLGVASAVVAAGAGTPVVAHSAGRLPTSYGATYRHVLEALGVPTSLDPAQSAAMVDETGFGFYDATRFNPRLDALADRRGALGIRTFCNTIETLANPAGASVHLGSFFHRPFAERIVGTLAESETVDVDRVVMVQGQEGYDDVRLGTTRLAEWDAQPDADGADAGAETATDRVTMTELETGAFGVDAEVVADVLEGSEAASGAHVADETDASDECEERDREGGRETVDALAESGARLTHEVVTGDRTDSVVDLVALNAGVRIYARGDEPTLTAAAARARRAIADGSAAEAFEALTSFEPPAVCADGDREREGRRDAG